MEMGCVHISMKKNQAVHSKTGPKIGRYGPRNWKDTIFFVWTEAVQYRTAFRTCLVSVGDTKLVSMTTSDVEVEIRPNCTSLILPIV